MDDLGDLLDRLAVQDLTVAYCTALDTKDYEALRAVFAPDAHAVLGHTEHHGIDSIIERIRTTLEPLDLSQHLIANHVVTIDGDRASCVCELQAQHVREAADGGPNYLVGGRYEDELVRTPDGWRIADRVLTMTWSDGNREVVRRARGS